MKRSDLDLLRAPETGEPLTLGEHICQNDEITEGTLHSGARAFRICNGIPRFVGDANYADSFGYQWQTFETTQLDSRGRWGAQSEIRLYKETRWPRDLQGQRILEAGSGMGRFTEILAATGARVCTFDYSRAIDANSRNSRKHTNVCFAQADINNPPYEQGTFDKILCIGVLQHCPSPYESFRSLVRFLKPGGEIVIDVYRLSWKSIFLGKYYVRPLTRKLPSHVLHRLVRLHVGWVYPVTGLVQRIAGDVGRKLSYMLSMADYRGLMPIDDEIARELSELDTFDMLSPAYDKPQTLRSVRGWFEKTGLVDIEVSPGYNGVEGRGKRP